jgi:putative transposase
MFHMQVWGAAHAAPSGKAVLEQLAKTTYPRLMDTAQIQEENRRKEILAFWSKHGLEATQDAFGVGRATLFRWKKDSSPKSRAHRNGYHKRVVHPSLQAEILRLRTEHPKLGKEKLTPLLAEFCASLGIPAPAEATVGRILAGLKKAGKLTLHTQLKFNGKTGSLREKVPTPKKKKLRREGYLPAAPGDLLQLDGVLTFAEGKRRYTFTAVDVVSRWAFSRVYKTASSRNGADFLRELLKAAPFQVIRIQTDNGSEFMKEFGEAVETLLLTHFFNWVRQPKYQGWVERFNRSIQEEFLDWRAASLAGNPDDFNQELEEWLTFYNTKRVHRSLGTAGHRLTPVQYLQLTEQSH